MQCQACGDTPFCWGEGEGAGTVTESDSNMLLD